MQVVIQLILTNNLGTLGVVLLIAVECHWWLDLSTGGICEEKYKKQEDIH